MDQQQYQLRMDELRTNLDRLMALTVWASGREYKRLRYEAVGVTIQMRDLFQTHNGDQPGQ